MTQNNDGIKNLKFALMFFTIANLLYGIFFLFLPGILRDLAGGNPLENGWIRWSGGPLIAFGIGASLVYRNPAKQGIFITAAAIGSLLIGLAMLYTLLFEAYTVHTWFILVPCVLTLVLFAVMLWARQGVKDNLGTK
jgi:hypothetical protein